MSKELLSNRRWLWSSVLTSTKVDVFNSKRSIINWDHMVVVLLIGFDSFWAPAMAEAHSYLITCFQHIQTIWRCTCFLCHQPTASSNPAISQPSCIDGVEKCTYFADLVEVSFGQEPRWRRFLCFLCYCSNKGIALDVLHLETNQRL